MPQASFNRRTLIVILSGVVIGVVGVPMLQQLADNREVLKPYDFVQYWSAGQQTLHGQNPYDPDQLVPIQRTMYDGVRKAIMMWNPPWTLPLTLPFAALPWRTAQFLWLALQLAAVLVSADLFWRIYGGATEQRWIAWLAALCFGPTLFLLLMGQITGFVLLGLAGFLHFIRKNEPIGAGCCAALTAIKPHLLPLFALALVLEATRDRPIRRAIAAGACILLIFSLVPLIWNANVWQQYFAAMGRPPSENFETMREFEHPTLGYYLRKVVAGEPFGMQFIPCLIALFGLLVFWWKNKADWSWQSVLAPLVLVSILSAGYGAWAFDLVLLLPAIIQMTVWVVQLRDRRLIAICTSIYVLLNVWLLTSIREPGSQSNPWIAPVVGISYLLFRWREGCRTVLQRSEY
jgi:Glycosyltransferase family 87